MGGVLVPLALHHRASCTVLRVILEWIMNNMSDARFKLISVQDRPVQAIKATPKMLIFWPPLCFLNTKHEGNQCLLFFVCGRKAGIYPQGLKLSLNFLTCKGLTATNVSASYENNSLDFGSLTISET